VDKPTLDIIAARPEVESVNADKSYAVPKPMPGDEQAKINAVEWGISRIKADQVWSTYNVRGEGIVVANIDTGVLYTHSALSRQYRGNLGSGVFDHNYNWHDPAGACGNGKRTPCDNNGHGTHTMGTMVGDDGSPGANQVGVAPNATWIAAKGCEGNTCSNSSLLSSGQWVLAPTDLTGNNARVDKRPHIVNNSWGGGGADSWYRATVQAWVAAGIFPVFSNGNTGPACGTVGSPGSYPESYGVGAFDINNAIASFSSRGAAPAAVGAQTKPDIAAPGVNIRSAWNNSSYATISGTSMAAPHLAGAIALLWSGAPSLIGAVADTRTLLDSTAVDTSDLQCGGTAGDNNVWGDGKLDALALLTAAPRGLVGTLVGTVKDGSGAAISGAMVRVSALNRKTFTDSDGGYRLRIPVGEHDAVASAFGYYGEAATGLVIADGTETTFNFRTSQTPRRTVSGRVLGSGDLPNVGATVTLIGTPLAPTTTDANGDYSFASVPEGTYTLAVYSADNCRPDSQRELVVDGNETLDIGLGTRRDAFGHTCRTEAATFVDGDTALALTGDDKSAVVALPFPFTFYGVQYSTAYVSTNGNLNFLAPYSAFENTPLPNAGTPNAAIYPFWDDLNIDASASMWTATLGTAPNRRFVVEWRNVHTWGVLGRVRFEVVLHENGEILTQYADIDNNASWERGGGATLGIENAAGSDALQYSFNERVVSDGLAIRYLNPDATAPETTIVRGLTQGAAAGVEWTGSDNFSSTDSLT